LYFFDTEHTQMLTVSEFVGHSDQATVTDAIGSQLEPTPVDVQIAGITTNNRTNTFDGRGISISLTDERTTSNLSGHGYE
jgi:hypothetical protein